MCAIVLLDCLSVHHSGFLIADGNSGPFKFEIGVVSAVSQITGKPVEHNSDSSVVRKGMEQDSSRVE